MEIWMCDDCHDELEFIIQSTGHDFDEGTVDVESTFEEHGTITYTCQTEGCGHTHTYELPLANHTYHKEEITKAPTCLDDGMLTLICSVCGHEHEETLGATGHDWGGGVITKRATATDPGEITYTCQNDNCGATYVVPYHLSLSEDESEIGDVEFEIDGKDLIIIMDPDEDDALETDGIGENESYTYPGRVEIVLSVKRLDDEAVDEDDKESIYDAVDTEGKTVTDEAEM